MSTLPKSDWINLTIDPKWDEVVRKIITNQDEFMAYNRKILREWPDVDTKQSRLEVTPTCDRSRPPQLFAVYDERGFIMVDDC